MQSTYAGEQNNVDFILQMLPQQYPKTKLSTIQFEMQNERNIFTCNQDKPSKTHFAEKMKCAA